MERSGLGLWPRRKRPKEPDHTMHLAIGRQLTEANSRHKHTPIRKHHAPGEAEFGVNSLNAVSLLNVVPRTKKLNVCGCQRCAALREGNYVVEVQLVSGAAD